MELSVWLTYFFAAIVLSVTPGPGVFSSISSGLHHGVKLGSWNAVGMQAANVIHVTIVAFGLGAVLLASETVFTAVKWLGVAYLIYLGIVTWRSPVQGFEDKADNAKTAREIFMRGFFVNLTNPKGIIFFVAVLPQFIDVARPQAIQYFILAVTTFAVDLVVMIGYIALAARVLRVMKDPTQLRWVNRGLGGLFVATGIALATFRRAAPAA
ncbi:LysE family transporter [Usitatibacter palustris]|uniref:Homoserine/homoserine lactone efflux protein n=1 Tax=Usitatibacter palustris TaxID=2732487 RepID=A0A6M4H341_9PROT|nr:LysE family transporter [Usitatibacter palustris]QJR13946.1 Homoserine/homoserine lactone efflux protein [Usitatibacter palustris]